MSIVISRTESDRRVKARGPVGGRQHATIAGAAARILGTQARAVEGSLAKLDDRKPGQARVHKLRAELRRMEVMLGTLGCGFHPKRVARLSKLVRRLRHGAGEVRDADVAGEVVERLCKTGDEPLRAAGKDVVRRLLERRQRGAGSLARQVRRHSGDVQKLVKEMLRHPAGPRALLPARAAANLVLVRESWMIGELAKQRLLPAEALHAARIHLKEARTVLELLREELPPGVRMLAERAKGLSDRLGQVNDLAMLVGMLEKLGRQGAKKRRRGAALALVLALAGAERGRLHERGAHQVRRQAPRLVRAIRRAALGEGA